jgi:Holliday junction resolvase RusA-like endonuclease
MVRKTYAKKRTPHRIAHSNANLESNLGNASLSKKKATRFTTPVSIVCTHYRTRIFDLDNGSIKAVLDQLVTAGVLTDDSSEQIKEITHRFVKTKGQEKTTFHIKEI